MQIVLKPVSSNIDMCAHYARNMGNNKIRHYLLPYSLALVKKFTGVSMEDVIREFIVRTENVEKKDVFFEYDTDFSFFIGEYIEGTQNKYLEGGITISDVSTIVLNKDKDIGRSLKKLTTKGMLHTSIHYKTALHKFYDKFSIFFNNRIVSMINRVLYALQGFSYVEYNPFVRQIKKLNGAQYIRRMNAVHYISIAFEAADSEKAIEALRQDLRILQKKKLIIGNFCMPSIMALSDTVGAGKYYTLFCFPIINEMKLMKISGYKSIVDMPHSDTLKAIGVKYEALEGDVKWLNDINPEKLYEIEYVYVKDLDEPDRHKMVLQHYQDSVEHVNSISKAMNEELKNTEKIKSSSEDFFDINGRHAIKIDTVVVNKKTGKVLDIEQAYGSADKSCSFAEELKWEDRKK